MSQCVELIYQGKISSFAITAIDRKRLHGFKRRIALDENGRECSSAHLTQDGRFGSGTLGSETLILSAGATSSLHINDSGDAVNRNDLIVVDADGRTLPKLSTTLNRPQKIKSVKVEEFLNHVATKVYLLEAQTLAPALHKVLLDGTIFRVPFRSRATYSETPAFLLANDNGIFLVQAEPCLFDFIGIEQKLDVNDIFFDNETAGEFNFENGWGVNHGLS